MIETFSCPGCEAPFLADVEPGVARVVECPGCAHLVTVTGRAEALSIAPPTILPPTPLRPVETPRQVRSHIRKPRARRELVQKEKVAKRERVAKREVVAVSREIEEVGIEAPGWLGATVGNLIWFVFGGFLMMVGYMIPAMLSIITIIGIPSGLQGIKIGLYAMWPFGKYVEDNGTGCFGALGNAIWFLFGGWALFLGHLLWSLIFTLLIVTFPFAKMHWNLAGLCISPYGKRIVSY